MSRSKSTRSRAFTYVGLVVLTCLEFTGSSLFGQAGSSTLTGRVTDTSGAVVPKVEVSIVQAETNFRFTAVTNDDGLYRLPSLSPGTYSLTFEGAGFKKFVREGIELRAGDTQAVDAVMQVGSLSESIEVKGNAAQLETETSATGSLMEGDTLHKLPLYQRYVNSTLNLTPGLSMGGYAYGGDLGSYHLAGQRNGAIGIFEDGVNGNEQTGGTTVIKPVQNSVEEVKVLTTTLPAEYGHSAGGVIAVVKKSGTNDIHGLAADYGRTRRMQHRLFFDNLKTSDPRPGFPNGIPTWFMDPEANVGGPVMIPKLYDGRNKTFFFFGYQKLIEKKAAQVIVNTPTPAMKAGDLNFGGVGNQIYDPATTRFVNGAWVRDPVPGNVIPPSRFDPVAAKILALNPWVSPNAPGTLQRTGPVSNLITAENSRTFFEDYSGRVDQQINQSFKLYGSWTYNHQSGLNRPTNILSGPFDGSQGFESPFTQKNASIGSTNIINPTMVNDVRAGYYRVRNDQFSYSAGGNWPQKLGIPNVDNALMPQFGAPGGDRYGASGVYGLTGNGNSRNIRETWSLRDDLTKIWGKHAFKAGYEL
ncbi:MAG: carboxypeptidase-like regulatory domain-containing protein, partial [Acidobacteriota bacterium]|nr:carboxypeptidase-like regulatory domain-containing protein [Acidobacteriota bacterium]